MSPDGISLIPWRGGRCLIWHATVTETLAASYQPGTFRAAAEKVAARKHVSYCQLCGTHLFVPLTFETLGPINNEGWAFLSALGQNLSIAMGDVHETTFLFQRLALMVQLF